MGIECSYRRVMPDEFHHLMEHPETADRFFGLEFEGSEYLDEDGELSDDEIDRYSDFLDELERSGRRLDLDKDWDAIHFLLTGCSAFGDNSDVPRVLRNAVVGGTNTPFDASYDKVRYLTPEEVRAVTETLSTITVDDLRKRFDPEAMTAAKVYPGARWDEEDLWYLLELYEKMVSFFRTAATAGDYLLLSYD